MGLRSAFVVAAAALAASAAAAAAADQPRRLAETRAFDRVSPGVYQRGSPGRRVAVERRAGRAGVFVTVDGEVLPKSYVDPEPPARVERRIYAREGARREFQLYGGFFGLDRWGYSRGGW
jgi:hypothetical protein